MVTFAQVLQFWYGPYSLANHLFFNKLLVPRGAFKEAEMYNANPLNLNRLRPAEERFGFMPTDSASRNFGE